MVGPPRVIAVRPVDRKAAGPFGQSRSGELVIKTPASIIIEGPAALAPPCVRPLDIPGKAPHHISKTGIPKEPVQIGTFLRKEPRILFICLGILDIRRRMRNVEIAAHNRLPAAIFGNFFQLLRPFHHIVQEPEFLLHLSGVINVAGMHIDIHNSEPIP